MNADANATQAYDEATSAARLREEVFRKACEHWNEAATCVASDAIDDVLSDLPEVAEELVAPISRVSSYWTEQIARAVLGLPSDDTEEFLLLRDALDRLGNSKQESEA